MSGETTSLESVALGDLLYNLQDRGELKCDGQLGKRFAPRCQLTVAVEVRLLTEADSEEPHICKLRDISETGLGVSSELEFEAEQSVAVELCVNNTRWQGRMRVTCCNKTNEGYDTGLELLEDLSLKAAQATEKENARCLEDPEQIEQIRDEIAKAMQAYHQARVVWAPLGKSAEKQILKVVKKMAPPDAKKQVDRQRNHHRRCIQGDVFLIVPSYTRWKYLRIPIIDVAEGGIGLLIPDKCINDLAERELAGRFKICPGTHVIVGLGADPNTLWVPAEVMHFADLPNRDIQLGVQFNTPGARETFGA